MWIAGLINCNAADDRGRIKRHVVPAFGKKRLADITLGTIMAWIDEQRQRVDADGERELSESSIRHNVNMLSRFFAWAIERGHATINPVRQIPTGKRPQQAHKRDVPWLRDDAQVRKLMRALPEPIDKMFHLGNRSGLRTGELAALRMADMGFLDEGVIRVRFSYDGPLKEDKHGTGKVKWAPAPQRARGARGACQARASTARSLDDAACVIQGAPITTNDLDMVHRRTPDNSERLLDPLLQLDATILG